MKYAKRKYRRRRSFGKYKRRRIVRRSTNLRRRKYSRRFSRRQRRYSINKVFKEVSITQRTTYNYELSGDGKWVYHNFSARWEDVSDQIAYYIAVAYDQIKLKKVTMKYWISNPMVTAVTPCIQPELITLYDPDGRGRSMDHDNMILSTSSKHRLLHHGRTHKLTLYPTFMEKAYIVGDPNHPHKVGMKSPWFDVGDIFHGNVEKMTKAAGSSYNGYLLGIKGAANNQNVKYTLTHTFLCKGKRRCQQYIPY